MYINEKNAEVVIEALAEQLRTLKADLWYKETENEKLKRENEKLKGEIEKLKGGE